MIKTRRGLGLAGMVVVGTIGVLGLTASGSVRLGLDHVGFAEPHSAPAWEQRIARVDAALGRSDVSRAIYEWREAYGAAVRTKQSEPLIAVAHRAIRLAERAVNPDYFRNEARYIYVHAALRARAEGSPDTILGIAETFDKLGDTERARQVRRIAEPLS